MSVSPRKGHRLVMHVGLWGGKHIPEAAGTADKRGWVQPLFHWSHFKCEKVKNNEYYTNRNNKNILFPMMLSQRLWWSTGFLLSVYLWGCLKKCFDNVNFRPQISRLFTSCVNASADVTDIPLYFHGSVLFWKELSAVLKRTNARTWNCLKGTCAA